MWGGVRPCERDGSPGKKQHSSLTRRLSASQTRRLCINRREEAGSRGDEAPAAPGSTCAAAIAGPRGPSAGRTGGGRGSYRRLRRLPPLPGPERGDPGWGPALRAPSPSVRCTRGPGRRLGPAGTEVGVPAGAHGAPLPCRGSGEVGDPSLRATPHRWMTISHRDRKSRPTSAPQETTLAWAVIGPAPRSPLGLVVFLQTTECGSCPTAPPAVKPGLLSQWAQRAEEVPGRGGNLGP